MELYVASALIRLPFLIVDLHESESNHGCVIVSVLASSAVDRGFESRSDQSKDHYISLVI